MISSNSMRTLTPRTFSRARSYFGLNASIASPLTNSEVGGSMIENTSPVPKYQRVF